MTHHDSGACLSADAAAAHDFLAELRTRITTQPLPYQHGAEARALESLWEVFAQARAAMKRYPGCREFAAAVTQLLNVDLRPVTAKWDRARRDGRLDSRDGADEFRADLSSVQDKLRTFATELQCMAYGSAGPPDALAPPVFTPAELDALCADLKFGIPQGRLITDDIVDKINTDEQREVQARRTSQQVSAHHGESAVGMSLSGGGIRSATFCLGVVQVLAGRRLLSDVDFLSTVSGGGYVGSFLTIRLGQDGSQQAHVANPRGPDTASIRYLRQHAKYLSAVNLKQSWSRATSAFAGMLLNWTAPVSLVLLAALLVVELPVMIPNGPGWRLPLAVSALVSALMLVAYGWLMRKRQVVVRWGGAVLALAIAVTVAIAGGWLLAMLYKWLLRQPPLTWTLTGVIAALGTTTPLVLRFVPIIKSPAGRKVALRILLVLAGLIVPIGGLALFYAGVFFGGQPSDAASWSPLRYARGDVLLGVAVLLLALIAFFILNINLTAPHRIYRDLLARTFIRTSEKDSGIVPLRSLNPSSRAPYHLINATVNLPSSTSPALRDRKSDFFLFSKHWCGSPVVGYAKTTCWKTNAAAPDLATAMAVSGAAASPHMGLESKPTLVALLTLLNVRLGFWICRPGHGGILGVPGFGCLIREMMGLFMSEKQAWLNLSDGGHIENMGTYELLRRRCKYVICVDGEADPTFTFQGLMTLVRHAQLDFGIRIEPQLDAMRPDPTSRRSQSHTALCRIHYPDSCAGHPAGTGLLLYMKLSVTGNEPELIRRYRTLHPDFPHQTTLDQFFGEEQFEAYRELGVHVAEGLFTPALIGPTAPQTVAAWFRQLAGNLLEPE